MTETQKPVANHRLKTGLDVDPMHGTDTGTPIVGNTPDVRMAMASKLYS